MAEAKLIDVLILGIFYYSFFPSTITKMTYIMLVIYFDIWFA